jgi:hypothetical protein
MMTGDGNRFLDAGNVKKRIQCSELTEALKFHANVSRAAKCQSEFRLLNGANSIMIGNNDNLDDIRYSTLMTLFDSSPSGGTPLCKHIRDVVERIREIAPNLRAMNQKACVIIATDGESSDGDIAQAMRPLKDLPVWVVVRLCTDEDRIVNYWNNIDSELELDMDVLDDICGEAKEVYEKNSWLTYGEPIHRIREFGIPIKEFDLLDEALLSMDQLRVYCTIMFFIVFYCLFKNATISLFVIVLNIYFF